MPYSLDEAKLLLQTTDRTPQALLNLVKQISVEATGAVTGLYGGLLPDGSRAADVVAKMVAAGEDIRVIDNAPVGKFLSSPDLLAAAGQALHFKMKLQRCPMSMPRRRNSSSM